MKAELAMRWTARLLSVGLAALFAAFAIGEGLPPVLPFSRDTLSFGCLVLSLTGLLAAWRFEVLGACVALAGAVGYYLNDFAMSGFRELPSGWVFPLMLVTPLLYLAAAALEHRQRAPRTVRREAVQ